MRASLTPQAAPESKRKKVDFDVLYDFRAGGKDGAITKQGFLRKQGNRNKGWKRRWFSLENSTISYYKARKDVVPIDVIELIKVTQVTSTPTDKNEKKSKFNIQLHTDKRVYQISAETQEEQRSWLFAIQRNHALSHAGAQDRFVQKAWNSVGLPRGTRGGSQIVELYGKHLTCSTSASGPTSATTEVVTWHIGDIKCTPDAMNDRLVLTTADNLTSYISLSTLDARSPGADTFLTDLSEAIEHNRKLEQPGLRAVYEAFLASQAMEDAAPAEPLSVDELVGRAQSLAENWPVRYKRGLLSVAVGRDEPMPAWVQVGGLVLSCFEKPDSPKPVCTLDLAQSEVTLESDSIVLNRDGGSKMWVLSGYNISSLKPASDINRLEWAVALWGNMKRLRKQRHLITDEKLIRFKRGCVKHNGTKAWCELDEYTLRFFHSAKALSWSTAVLLQTITDMKATTTELWIKTFGGDEHTLGFEALGAEWKGAIQNNVAILKQILAGKTPSLPAAALGARGGTRSPNGSPTKYPGGAQSGEYATAAALVHVRSAAGAEIQPDEISLGAKLGDGCFGAVFRGVCRANDVAVKIPLVQLQDLDETQLQLLRTEVEIMSANPHPNIVLFMGACTIPGQFKIVTELMHGDLDTLIKRSGLKFSLFEKMRMAKDAALGVNWLHCSNPPIIHRDLKAANLLYNKNETSYKVKVCDFGLSAIKPTSTMKDQGGAKGTPLFMAPEVMMQEEFDEKADVYSFGIVLWEIVTGKDPFPHHSDYTEFVRAVVEDEERPPLPADCPTHLRQLIESCWDAYPENRPDFDEINSVLDEIIVEAAISELSACRFWLRYFIKEYVVTWVDFVRALYEYLDETPLPRVYDVDEVRYLKGRGHGGPIGPHASPDDLAYKCLKALLAVKEPFGEGREVVTIEAFNRFVEWFGPIKDAAPSGSASATTPEPTTQLFTRILTTLAQPWFHGVLSSPEAEQKLTRGGVGSFLVRYSSQPGAFTLSCVSATAGITSYRLLQPLGCGQGFVLDNEHRYPSLVLLVQALEGPLRLEMPCEGSPFARIFKDPTYLPLAPDQAVSDETYCLWDVAKLPAP